MNLFASKNFAFPLNNLHKPLMNFKEKINDDIIVNEEVRKKDIGKIIFISFDVFKF